MEVEVTKEEAQKRAYKKVNNRWVDNPETLPLDLSKVPDKVFVEIDHKVDPKRSHEEETRKRLKAEAVANKKFKELSEHMYIFGRGQYFELDVDDMVNVPEAEGIIVRPLEKRGIEMVLHRMVKVNYSKQILTVMPNTATRPTCWNDCVKAGALKIINGQHTWKAAKEIISGETSVDDKAIVDRMHKWTCQIVWSDNKSHLHALSSKCNDGNVDAPFLSSLAATIVHCRYLWENAKRPPHFRKNAHRDPALADDMKRYEVCCLPLFESGLDRTV